MSTGGEQRADQKPGKQRGRWREIAVDTTPLRASRDYRMLTFSGARFRLYDARTDEHGVAVRAERIAAQAAAHDVAQTAA